MPSNYAEYLITAAGDAAASAGEAGAGAAKKLLLDAMACAAAAARAPGVGPLVDYARDRGGRAEASALVFGERLPMAETALVNAALIHAWDLDDALSDGCAPVHVTSVIVPTVLACGEARGGSGADALGAMIAGIEAFGRLATVGRGRLRGPGFLPTSIFGGFAAVIAAGRLLGLTESRIVEAMGIQYARCSGNRQALLDHTLTKRLQPGFAARSAIESALLAERGITGPRAVFEGEAGFFKLYLNGDVPDADEWRADHGRPFVERVSTKRYPSCGACHHVQIAAERLVATHDLKRGRIDRVSLINCDPAGIVTGPFEPGEHPSVAAQFSAEWAMARTLLRGPATLADYIDDAVAGDAEVIALANAIANGPPPDDVELPEPKAQGVMVHTTDGRRLVEWQAKSRTFPPGGTTWERTVEKFHQCVAFVSQGAGRDPGRVVDLVARLEAADDLRPLIEAMGWRADHSERSHHV